MSFESYNFGKASEKKAQEYLKTKGYIILETNYRYDRAEVDIIAKYKNIIVVIEVKSLKNNYFAAPENAVNFNKRKNIIKVINQYLIDNKIDLEVRFDIISIVQKTNEINHIENAFNITC